MVTTVLNRTKLNRNMVTSAEQDKPKQEHGDYSAEQDKAK